MKLRLWQVEQLAHVPTVSMKPSQNSKAEPPDSRDWTVFLRSWAPLFQSFLHLLWRYWMSSHLCELDVDVRHRLQPRIRFRKACRLEGCPMGASVPQEVTPCTLAEVLGTSWLSGTRRQEPLICSAQNTGSASVHWPRRKGWVRSQGFLSSHPVCTGPGGDGEALGWSQELVSLWEASRSLGQVWGSQEPVRCVLLLLPRT